MEEETPITFKAYNPKTREVFAIEEEIPFNGECFGTIDVPVVLHTLSATRIGKPAIQFRVSSKPLRDRLYIYGNTEAIKSVSMVSMNGNKLVYTSNYSSTGIDISHVSSGLYIVTVISNDGSIFYDKVFKL